MNQQPTPSPFWRRPIWLLGHAIALTAVVLFVRLSFWQLDRHDERRERNAVIAARADGPPVDVLGVDLDTGEFRRVTATGTFDADGEVLIRNRSLQGTVGFHVVTPLDLADGRSVLVNRGWIPTDLERRPPGPPPGTVTVEGILLASQRRGLGPRDAVDGRLAILNRVDVARIQQQTRRPLIPLWLSQTAPPAEGAGGYPIRLDPPARDAGPHLSYAGQWLLFALVVGVGYPLLLRRRARTVEPV